MKRFNKDTWRFPLIQHAIPTEWGWVVLYPQKFNLQRFVDIGWGTFINARYGVELNEECQIGPYSSILSDNTIDNQNGKVIIGKGAKIGAYSLILPNVIINPGEFIKARSIVYIDRNGNRKVK